MYLDEYIEKFNDKFNLLKDKENIVIWGAAENTVRLLQYTDILKYSIKYFVDNNKTGKTFFGNCVHSPQDIDWNIVDVVVISSFFKEKEIKKELINNYDFKGTIITLNSKNQKMPFYQYLSYEKIDPPEKYKKILAPNIKFKNIHNGERLFILCTGPSINEIDLCKLKHEHTMAVSNFYMHKDIDTINLDYYCIPQVTYTDKITEKIVKKWIKEMIIKGKAKEYFFNLNEKKIIDEDPFFLDKNINYLYFNELLQNYEHVDLTKKINAVQTVPILCIEIAIYMGFKEIILLGVDFQHFVTDKYTYFYNREQNFIGKMDSNVDEDEKTKWTFKNKIQIMNETWEQFKNIKSLGEENGVQIYNANEKSIVDIFDKINYDSLFY